MKEYDYNRILGLFSHYGYDNQVLQLAQECGELISSLNRYRQIPESASPGEHYKVIDEIKDKITSLSIVLIGISNYFCFFKDELEKMMIEEVDKQWEKIDFKELEK